VCLSTTSAKVLPLRHAPGVNVLLATLMAGTVLREAIRLGVPNGGNPKPFPALLPGGVIKAGSFSVGIDSVMILAAGLLLVLGTHLLITRTRFGLAIRAVAQDGEVARLSGIDFQTVVLGTFALGSALAAFAGCMLGLYYREINFNMGVLLGIIGFASAVVGGLGRTRGLGLAIDFRVVKHLDVEHEWHMGMPFRRASRDPDFRAIDRAGGRVVASKLARRMRSDRLRRNFAYRKAWLDCDGKHR